MEYVAEILKQWKEESGCKGVIQFKYSYSTGILTLYTSYPGYLIGRAGCHIIKYTEILKNQIHSFNNIKFEETDFYYIA